MKSMSLAIASMGLIIGLNADTISDLIAAKEIWGEEYSDAPSNVNDGDYDYDVDDNKSEPWPKRKPQASEGTGSPSLLVPKAEKEIFENGQGSQ